MDAASRLRRFGPALFVGALAALSVLPALWASRPEPLTGEDRALLTALRKSGVVAVVRDRGAATPSVAFEGLRAVSLDDSGARDAFLGGGAKLLEGESFRSWLADAGAVSTPAGGGWIVAGPVLERAVFSAALEPSESRLELGLGELGEVRVRVHNTSLAPLPADRVRLSYHLEDADGGSVQFDGERAAFGAPLLPGESVVLDLPVRAPVQAGRYVLKLDLVEELLTWFSLRGNLTPTVELSVSDLLGAPPPSDCLALDGGRFAWRVDGSPALDALQHLVHRTLDRNLVTFTGLDGGVVRGFSAGGGYPELWIRDNATVMPAARFRDDAQTLTSWIVAHLTAQADDGELLDFLRADGTSDKNSAASDQETSLVHAARTATDALGPGWLRAEVGGKTVLARLDAAVGWLLAERVDPETGLVRSAHTADWGDVGAELPDHGATDLVDGGLEVVGIYPAAMLHRALIDLSSLHREAGDLASAERRRKDAQKLAAATRGLWSKDHGHFLVHRHVDGSEHEGFDERAIFAMGGNVEAIRAGLASRDEAGRIFERARAVQRDAGHTTLGGVLTPPYPAGTFRHPALDEPFEYQNGGQWDWFAGRLLLEMAKRGEPDALAGLEGVAAQVLRNGGLYEWLTPSGLPRGSPQYAGSAGALAQAVIEGLFGVAWRGDVLSVTPRAEGCLYLPQPSTGTAFAIESARTGVGLSIRVRAPAGAAVKLRVPEGKGPVLLDGRPVASGSLQTVVGAKASGR